MRSSGVLLHLSSLPAPHGVGTMGRTAREFVDFLEAAGQSVWQLLPIGPTGYGDSPYQSVSSFAGNPYFIDLDELADLGLLAPEEYRNDDWGDDPERVDFCRLYEGRFPVLRMAARRLLAAPPSDFSEFCRDNAFWLPDYALFMALKNAQGGGAFQTWPVPLQRREPTALARARERYADDVAFWMAVQYLFFHQWRALKAYANCHGISILGDAPIYVAADSADLWARPDQFQLDENGRPSRVAGCPPDAFSDDGQLWGNPLYDWVHMAGDGYAWWIRRIGVLCERFDMLRIDHFRGFCDYYAIPYGAPDARAGVWEPGPGMALFRAVETALGRQRIIAEDLGTVTDGVRQLLHDSGFPGMKVLEFAFDGGDSAYLPHRYDPHCVAYTGTHDNDTVLGWFKSAPAETARRAEAYFGLNRAEGYNWGMLRGLWSSVAELTVVQAQDLLGLGSEGRMNTPAVPEGNWRWRARPGVFDGPLAEKLRCLMGLYGRLP